MARNSKIEWCDDTWNPITGCSVVSPGCTNCYAMKLAGTRMKNHWSRSGLTQPSKAGPVWNSEVRLNLDWIDQPLHWRKPRKIFVCAHGDLFHEDVQDEWIDRIFAIMARCPQHTFQVLTKRADRMREYFRNIGGTSRHDWVMSAIGNQTGMSRVKHFDWPLPNVHLGVSVEDQTRADERIPLLLDTPAAVRFISAEPLLGPIYLTKIRGWKSDEHLWTDATTGRSHFDSTHYPTQGAKIDQVIVGGESGPGARPMHPDWARSLRDQCKVAGVAFYFKQWGEWAPALHDPDEPQVLRQIEEVGRFNSWDAKVYDTGRQTGINWRKLGKKAAGRLLDGREWNGMGCQDEPRTPLHAR
ncbi:MAG: phage Gp37/Gp68 family protein [Alphaproteobacteria bacterium]|nr:phage Gp37/Gp68 family protein [Alphaproteobacteria bacterium]